MPEARDYFVVALGSVAVLSVIILVAIGRVWRTISIGERISTVIAALIGLGVVGYWLLLYKAQSLQLHRTVWVILWFFAAAGITYLVTRGLIHVLHRQRRDDHQPDRRVFIERSIAAAAGIVVATPVATYDPADVVVERYSVDLPHLPLSAHGLTLAVLSDIHAGAFIEPKHVAYYIDIIAQNHPDVVLLPGDFITAFADEFAPYPPILAQLRAPLGVYAVLGNHDYFNGAWQYLHSMLERAGIRVLDEDVVEIAGIELFGISDDRRTAIQSAAQSETIVSIAERLSRAACPIVMVHRPFVFDALATINPRVLTIAGHTHGGQIAVELFNGEPVAINRLFTRYIRGWYRCGSAALYITRGVGTIGLPMRIGAPPEITVLTLRRE